MFKKFKDWLGPHLDIFKVSDASDVGSGLTKHEWQGETTATQVGTTINSIIMNDLQKGLVATARTSRTIGSNKDIYTVDISGLEEYGIFEGLKILLNIDNTNQFENAVIKIGTREYPIQKIKNGINVTLGKEVLKSNSHYLVVFKNNNFVLIQDTNFGTDNDTSLEGKRLKEIIGLEFGGNVQDSGTKTTGKFYFDSITGHYFECIQNTSDTFTSATKFRAISNKPIADRLENLFKDNQNGRCKIGNVLIQWGSIEVKNTNNFVLVYPLAYKQTPTIAISQWQVDGIITHRGRNNTQCPFFSTGNSISLDWIAIGII